MAKTFNRTAIAEFYLVDDDSGTRRHIAAGESVEMTKRQFDRAVTANCVHADDAADEEARAAADRRSEANAQPKPPDPQAATTSESGPVDIPEDWDAQHHNTRMALARRIAPDQTVDTAEAADAIIRAEADRRAAASAELVAQQQ